jgi:hypothetical protein
VRLPARSNGSGLFIRRALLLTNGKCKTLACEVSHSHFLIASHTAAPE